MPLTQSGNYIAEETLKGVIASRRNFLEVAARRDKLDHPAAVQWQREIVDAEALLNTKEL